MLKFAMSTKQAKYLSRQLQDKKLRRIYHGIYTDDLTSSIEQLVQKNWMQIVSFIIPEGILSHRTAVDLKPFPFKSQYIVFITSTYTKTINLPGLIIKIYQGDNHHFIEPVLPNLARSNMPRFLLENLNRVTSHYKNIKTVGTEGVEFLLARELRLRGENRINQIRDEAYIIAEKLSLLIENEKLNKIISALLGTHSTQDILSGSYAKAIARKEPYDYERVRLFDKLTLFLKQCDFIQRKFPYTANSFKNLSFYESYFSNYIEGTEFMIDEAEDIVFKGLEIDQRHADSHDVLATFSLTNDYADMSITPQSAEQLIELLQNRHALLMHERPEKRPGEFKLKPNKAGNTYFVMP
ncbi:MAG: cell filamentation protein Fic, partial [Gammaproteobacteria bacterium]